MKSISHKLSLIIFILTLSFFIFNWSYVIYPLFSNSGTIGNSILVIILSIFWSWCATYTVSIFLKIKKKLKIILFGTSPLLLILSVRLNSEAHYRGLGNWIRDISNWQINIYYFDWGGWLIFSSLGLFCMLSAIISLSIYEYYNKSK